MEGGRKATALAVAKYLCPLAFDPETQETPNGSVAYLRKRSLRRALEILKVVRASDGLP